MATLPAAVLWDLDGTLIDTEPYWIACEYELVAQFGGRWSDEDAHSIVGFDLLDSARVIRDRGGVDLPLTEIVERLVAAVSAKIRERMPWRPGAKQLLEALNQAGVPCALVTMSWKAVADEVLRRLPPDSFQAVITGDIVLNGKPHPEPYRRAASELAVDPLSCVAIEDSPPGVASAEAAGCVVVAVPFLVAVPSAPHRVTLSTLEGVTPWQLGEWVEMTPPPVAFDAGGAAGAAPVSRQRLTDDERRAWQRGKGLQGVRDALGDFGRGLAGGGRGRLTAAFAAFVVLLAAGLWWFVIRDSDERYRPGAFRVSAWVPPWDLEDHVDTFGDNATLFQQVSPFWYQVTGLSSVGLYENTPEEATADVLAAARRHGIPIVASLFDQTAPGTMAAILADPATRALHIDAIVAFANRNDFQGLDINYERFAFHDGKDTWATTRPNWVAFITELGARLHADGKLLTVSVPWVRDDERDDDSGYWVYDYGAIVDHVDAIRIMAYDYSTDEPGPIAPLDWVREIVEGGIDAAGGPEKLVLGIPLYGRNWVIATRGECPPSAVRGTQSPRLDSIDDLIERRDANPVYDQTTDEYTFTYQVTFTEGDVSCTQTREVHYADATGVRNRMQLSVDEGLLGIALFAFGYQTDTVFDDIIEIDASLETQPPDAEE